MASRSRWLLLAVALLGGWMIAPSQDGPAHAAGLSPAGIALDAADVSHDLGQAFVDDGAQAGTRPLPGHGKAKIYARFMSAQAYLDAIDHGDVTKFTGPYAVVSEVVTCATTADARWLWHTTFATGRWPLVSAAGTMNIVSVDQLRSFHSGTLAAAINFTFGRGSSMVSGTNVILWIKKTRVVGSVTLSSIGTVMPTTGAILMSQVMEQRMEVK